MPTYASRSLWTSAVAPPPVFDPATLAWVAAVIANGGTVSAPREQLVDDLIVGLKDDGVWNSLDRLWLFAAENEFAAEVDLVANTVSTPNVSPTFTPDQGYTCNGSTSYVDLNYGPSNGAVNFIQDSASLSVWCNTNRATANMALTGAIGPGGANADLWPYTAIVAPTGLLVRVNDSFTMLANSSSLGFFTNNRSGVSACEGYWNGSSLGSTTDAAVGLSAQNFAVGGGLQSGGSLNGPSTDQCSAAVYGGSRSSTDEANLYSRLRTYMTAVGVP